MKEIVIYSANFVPSCKINERWKSSHSIEALILAINYKSHDSEECKCKKFAIYTSGISYKCKIYVPYIMNIFILFPITSTSYKPDGKVNTHLVLRFVCVSSNNQNRQTSVRPAGFELAIRAGDRLQTHALDRLATGIGRVGDSFYINYTWYWFVSSYECSTVTLSSQERD